MNTKFKNKFTVIILAIVALTMFIGCASNNSNKIKGTDNASKIVGTWKRTDREVGVTVTFTANGDYIVKTATSSLTGKYELKNDNLRTFFPQSKDGKDDNSKIFKLEDNLMILEIENNGEKKYSKLEKISE
jgi:hypothetical protein